MADTSPCVSDSDVVSAFKDIDEDLSSKSDIVEKCMSICHQHGLSATSLANEWEAHSMSRAGSDDAHDTMLTLSSLAALEANMAKKNATRQTPKAPSSTSRPMFNSSTLPTTEGGLRKALNLPSASPSSSSSGPAAFLMSPPPARSTHTHNNSSSKDNRRASLTSANSNTPAHARTHTHSGVSVPRTPMIIDESVPRATPSGVSPASLQSPADNAVTYASRTNAGSRVLDVAMNRLGHRSAFVPSKRLGGVRVDIVTTLEPDAPDINLTERYRYMYTTCEERARALERALLRIQSDMAEQGRLTEDPTPVGVPRQEAVVVVGRICCEAPVGRINRASVLLEGSRRDSGGSRVKLDLSALQGFALFPGQVVGVEGVNSSGYKMVVRNIIEGVPRPSLTFTAARIKEYHYDPMYQGGAPVSVLVASGPYTTNDSLEYEPLSDLFSAIAHHKPDVAILCGPFVDASHPKLSCGEADIEGDAGLETVDFESLFKLRVSYLIDNLYKSHPGLPTRLVLVPSLNDVFHDHVFPQPPLSDRIPGGVNSPWFEDESLGVLGLPFAEGEGQERRVHCVSNPCMFRINEVVFGVTTNDILLHLSGDEVSLNQGNRLQRLAAHLVQQQSFYPLFPPPADKVAQLDMRHSDRWRMPVTPDVLLLPSKLAMFAKDVQGCMVVNPGQLCKGTSGGTYAIMHIHPLPQSTLDAAAEDARLTHHVAGRVAVEVLRI